MKNKLMKILKPDSPAQWLLLIFLVGLAFRLWGITNPLLDFHSWRQTLTATIAKNFYVQDMNILNPTSNLVEPFYAYEFHIYTFLVALLYKIFGFHDIFGRLVSVAFALGTMGMLYLLVKRFYDRETAAIATAFFAVLPFSVYYTRTFMPESAMLFFSISMVYFFSLWLETERGSHFTLASLCATLAFLVKLPTLYLGGPLLFLAWLKFGRKIFVQGRLYLFVVIVLLPPLLWYGYTSKLQSDAYGGTSIWLRLISNWEVLTTYKFYQLIFWTRLVEKMFAFTAFPFLVLGMLSPVEKKEQYVFHIWFLCVCAYFFIAPQLNMIHEYYQIPIIPVGAVFIGKFLRDFFKADQNRLAWKGNYKLWVVVLLIVFVPIHSAYKLKKRLRYNTDYLTISATIKEQTQPGDRIVLQDRYTTLGPKGSGAPQIFYFSDRKGWIYGVDYSLTPGELQELIDQGARYYAMAKFDPEKMNGELYSYLSRKHTLMVKNPLVTIFKLNPV